MLAKNSCSCANSFASVVIKICYKASLPDVTQAVCNPPYQIYMLFSVRFVTDVSKVW